MSTLAFGFNNPYTVNIFNLDQDANYVMYNYKSLLKSALKWIEQVLMTWFKMDLQLDIEYTEESIIRKIRAITLTFDFDKL